MARSIGPVKLKRSALQDVDPDLKDEARNLATGVAETLTLATVLDSRLLPTVLVSNCAFTHTGVSQHYIPRELPTLCLTIGTNAAATADCGREICLGRNCATHAHNPGTNLHALQLYYCCVSICL